jgi:microcystin-dependent protein
MVPYIGQILCVGFNFAPIDWAICDGSLLPISEYSVLYGLIGTTYGGDGVTNFALPDLRGRAPVHQGQGYVLGTKGGAEAVTINAAEYPNHTHPVGVTSATASATDPGSGVLAATPGTNLHASAAPVGTDLLNGAMCATATGGSASHENRQPYVICNWIIALAGEFPSQG